MALLTVRNLAVRFAGVRDAVLAVDGVDLDVAQGECVALVGESGSGKSQLLLACTGLLAAAALPPARRALRRTRAARPAARRPGCAAAASA